MYVCVTLEVLAALKLLVDSNGPFTLGDTNLCEAAHMRQRNTVTEAHIQRSVHIVSATECYSPSSVSPKSLENGPSSPCSAVSCCCLLCEEEGKKVEKFSVSHGWNVDLRLEAMPKYL